MFLRHLGRQLLIALALGLIILPAASWATTVTIPKPFSSYATYTNPNNPGVLPSLSVVGSVEISNSAIFVPDAPATPPPVDTYNAAVNAAAPAVTYFSTGDLMNNDLIIVPATQDAAHALATYQAVNDAVRSASDGGAYDGKGLTSGTVAQDINVPGGHAALALGVLLNDDGFGAPIWGGADSDNGAFDGYSNLTRFDTIVKYTFIGDLLLEGVVSAGDLNAIFPKIGTTPSGNSATTQTWQSGDEFYLATGGSPIQAADFNSSFANLTLEGQYPFVYHFGQSAASLSVPEPSSVLLALLAVAGLFAKRIVRRRKAVGTV